MERLIPAYRPETRPIDLPIPEPLNLAGIGSSIINAIGTGEISPDQGAQVLAALASQSRIIEVTELEKRIAALEKVNVN